MTQDQQPDRSSLEARVEELEASLAQSNGKLSQREAEVAELRKQLEISRLVTGTLIHDLRNPLSIILTYLAFCQDILPKDEGSSDFPSKMGEYLGEVYSATNHMHDIMTHLYNLMDPKWGVMLFDTDIYNYIIKPGVSRSGLDVRYYPETLPTDQDTVYADQFIARRVFDNLLKNAADHGGDNPVITVGHRINKGRPELYVRNTGSYIAEADRRKVFNLEVRRPESEGLGLGLNLCKRYAELMGGYLRADSSGQPSDGNMQNAWAEFSLGFPLP
jgi:signal transduction histidine kinase